MKFTNYFWDPLKIDNTNVYFWSDMHLGHRCERWESPLWKNRGFSSIEEHDESLIAKWNNKININSTVFHLGDIMFGGKGEERLPVILDRLNFKTLYLFPGNHTAGFKQILNNSRIENGAYYFTSKNRNVCFVPNYLEIIVCGQPIVLSHFPIASWNGQGKGSWMIHGHCHGNLYNSDVGKLLYTNCKIIDVGIEKTSEPISFSDIRDIFKNIANKTFDHHNENTQNPF